MGGSRRKYRKSRPKVRVGLPRKKPGLFKPAFTVPPKLLSSGAGEWDDEASVIRNYRSLGVVANPNLLGIRARTPQILQCPSLQMPPSSPGEPLSEFDPFDSGSDLESDGLKCAVGKKTKDGKSAPLQPLTTIQRVHIGRLIDKYGDDYQAMFVDTGLNAMQHSVGELKKLCRRYYVPNPKRAAALLKEQEDDANKTSLERE